MRMLADILIPFTALMIAAVPVRAGETAAPDIPTYADIHESDWSQLKTGKEIGKQEVSHRRFQKASAPLSYAVENDAVIIRDQAWDLDWTGQENDWYGTNFIHVRNVATVVLDNVAIRQTTPGYDSADDTVRIQGCQTAIIKNSYFAGPTRGAHLRIDNCERVIIMNNEIAGIDFDPDDDREYFQNGAGIVVTNDPDYGLDAETGLSTVNYAPPRRWVIQNNYIHDYTDPGAPNVLGPRNQDAVAVVSPPDGVFFNNVVENWRSRDPEAGETLESAIDACYDLAYETDDPAFSNKVFRTERNIFNANENCKTTQSSANPTNTLLIVNNIYINTYLRDYHQGYDVYHIHNTYYFDEAFHQDTFLRLSQADLGRSHFYNNLIYSTGSTYWNTYNLNKFCFESPGVIGECARAVMGDFNVYRIAIADYEGLPWWVYGNEEDKIEEFAVWQSLGKDLNSLLFDDPDWAPSCFAVDFAFSVNRRDLLSSCPVVNAGSPRYLKLRDDPALVIERDFWGRPRDDGHPDAGAFEFVSDRAHPGVQILTLRSDN